jgi:signal transduction histidine kinase
MLDHIAHQWKQPLNSISLIIQDLESSASDGELSKEYIEKNLGKVMALLDHMAQTINVFREFYHPDKEKAVFSIKDSIDTACHFIAPMLRLHGIEVEFDVDLGVAAVGYSKEYAHRSRPDESSFFMAKEFAVNQLSSSPENHVGN